MVPTLMGVQTPKILMAVVLLGSAGALAQADRATESTSETCSLAAECVARAISEVGLRELVFEVLDRNPELAGLEAEAEIAEHRASVAGGLPDPRLGLVGYLSPPETRVGPQRVSAELAQPIPWSGKRELRKSAERQKADLVLARLASRKLDLVTEIRQLFLKRSLLIEETTINRELLEHLERHEEIARARYATGVGQGQGVLKLQAELTRVESRMIELDERLRSVDATINRLRDRSTGHSVPVASVGRSVVLALDLEQLTRRALERHPEIWEATAAAEQASLLMQLADLERRPDFVVGLTYAWVDQRGDEAGRVSPPADNGQDIFGIRGGVTIPIWGKKRRGLTAEAEGLRRVADEHRRAAESEIRTRVGDLVERVPLLARQLELLESLLIVQATEALESAQAGYVAGTLNALDLLDAEHVLFNARLSVARSDADLNRAIAELEGAVGSPITPVAQPSGGLS